MRLAHHLTDETVQDYACGSLGPAMETLIACHLTVCRSCRWRASMADAVGGLLLAEQDEVPVSGPAADVLARVRTAATSSERTSVQAADAMSATTKASGFGKPACSDAPRPLARLLPADLDDLPWRRIAPGIRQFNLSERHRRDGVFKLLHLSPGVTLMSHGHSDRELTYVVRGSYTDSFGRFNSGDIADLDESKAHRPVVDTDEPCIALIATNSPARYSGIFGRLLQPFIGI